jgi:hypothetical protein
MERRIGCLPRLAFVNETTFVDADAYLFSASLLFDVVGDTLLLNLA